MGLAEIMGDQRTLDRKSAEQPIGPIGRDNEKLRVLSFSGRGFDTVMQLGVTHALLVSQGKAPDVVVGDSAGAAQAAALAEIIRAGTPPDGVVSPDDYRQVLGQRVKRFRQFADAWDDAPQLIVDTLVPDAYQIDSFEPLASLRLPRLSAAERDERDEWIVRKTGLVRLYNDILSIDLPLGAVTRLVRRWLGMTAASALASRGRRIVLRTVEFMRFWLVIGTELRRLAPTIPVLMRPLYGSREKVQPSTAGSIIFKFRPVEGFWRFAEKLWSFLFLLSFWVAVSWFVASLPFMLVALFGFYLGTEDGGTDYLFVFYLLYLLPIVLPLTPIAIAYDKTRFGTALTELSKGLFAFFFYLVKWTIVLCLLLLAGFLLGFIIYNLLPMGSGSLADLGAGKFREQALELLIASTAVLVVIRIFFAIIRVAWEYRQNTGKYKVPFRQWYLRKFLDHYHIGPAIAHNYNLKRILIKLFDPSYYGHASIESDLGEILQDSETSGFEPAIPPEPATLTRYLGKNKARDQKIMVAVTAADVGDGDMLVIPQTESIVDSLLAAMATTPVFPPVLINNRLLIDAVDIGTTSTRALVELFRDYKLADVESVQIYAVDPLPISQSELGPYAPVGDNPYVNLIDIVMRSLQLQRYRDATIERKLTRIISATMPPNRGTVEIEIDGVSRKFFKAEIIPIELEYAPDLNRKFLFGEKMDRRAASGATLASGCRASLEVMHSNVIRKLAKGRKYKKLAKENKYEEGTDVRFIKCQDVIDEVSKIRPYSLMDVKLPGSGDSAPGLAEVCRHCKLLDRSGNMIHGEASQCLRIRDRSPAEQSESAGTGQNRSPVEIADWPHELADQVPGQTGNASPPVRQAEASAPDVNKDPDKDYPSIACLFSGGVFRGVFQLGVLNALGLLDVSPRVVAGASVGSITAAMVASALSEETEDERSLKICKLAATYVGIDRIILTDRFADFVRNWTIRASESKFSVRQLDRVFRKYDEGRGKSYQRNLRQVLAGIERLFYINPYQLNRIVRSIRNLDGECAIDQLKQAAQHWLDRMNVGKEVLGAEPIRMLIEDFVIPKSFEGPADSAPFDCIDPDLVFLATTTNLTKGRLEILSSNDPEVQTSLIEGLLASSAFPGVFRPRLSWDLQPGSSEIDQFVDGGVMDNLPLDSVLQTMRNMADEKVIPLRPKHGPHLMLAASLEVDTRNEESLDIGALKRYWPELRSRASELKYNRKLDSYQRVTDHIQEIYNNTEGDREPLSVKVLAIKPRWLCNTFAFHPMLGFRRLHQVRSIAHGCAATLIAFSQHRNHACAWKLSEAAVPENTTFDLALKGLEGNNQAAIRDGKCWLQDKKCPFSAAEVGRTGGPAFDKNTRKWLSQIHRRCWESSTHTHQ